jgi:hypothetical protein
MEAEKPAKKSLANRITDAIGSFLLFILVLVVIVCIFGVVYVSLELIFENPVSLGIICATIIIIALIWSR